MAKAQTQEKLPQRSLKGDFKGITLSRSETGALTVDVSALNGVDVTIITNGDGRIVKQSPVEEQNNAPDAIQSSVDKKAYNIGDVLPDGWVVGPVSPTTGKPIAIEPVEGAIEGYQTWYKGEDHAKELRSQGHENARQPDADELNSLYSEVVKAGRNENAQFNTSGYNPHGTYWSSTPRQHDPKAAQLQYFGGDGRRRGWAYKDNELARVRVVRDESELTLA